MAKIVAYFDGYTEFDKRFHNLQVELNKIAINYPDEMTLFLEISFFDGISGLAGRYVATHQLFQYESFCKEILSLVSPMVFQKQTIH